MYLAVLHPPSTVPSRRPYTEPRHVSGTVSVSDDGRWWMIRYAYCGMLHWGVAARTASPHAVLTPSTPAASPACAARACLMGCMGCGCVWRARSVHPRHASTRCGVNAENLRAMAMRTALTALGGPLRRVIASPTTFRGLHASTAASQASQADKLAPYTPVWATVDPSHLPGEWPVSLSVPYAERERVLLTTRWDLTRGLTRRVQARTTCTTCPTWWVASGHPQLVRPLRRSVLHETKGQGEDDPSSAEARSTQRRGHPSYRRRSRNTSTCPIHEQTTTDTVQPQPCSRSRNARAWRRGQGESEAQRVRFAFEESVRRCSVASYHQLSQGSSTHSLTLLSLHWGGGTRTEYEDVIDPMTGKLMMRVPLTSEKELKPFLASLAAVPKSGLHNRTWHLRPLMPRRVCCPDGPHAPSSVTDPNPHHLVGIICSTQAPGAVSHVRRHLRQGGTGERPPARSV
jgi:hypothetical protein